jgi:hypothetical protein
MKILVVQEPTMAAPFSITNTAIFPLTLTPGAEETVNFEFYENTKSIYPYTVKFLYTSGASPESELEVQLTGEVKETGFSLSVSSIDFGTLTGCEDSKEDSFEITNTGDVDIQILKPTTIHTEFPNLPIDIAAGATETIQITYRPQGTGPVPEAITFEESVCGKTQNFTASGTKNSMSITYSQESIEFGTIYSCNSGQYKTPITLSLEGADEFTVITIGNFQNSLFSSDVSIGDKFSDASEMEVIFDANVVGEYYDTLRITYTPCDIIKVLPVHAKVVESSYAFDNMSHDFGTVAIGNPQTWDMTFTNNNEDDLVITTISGLAAPYALTSHDIAADFPLTIPAGGNEVFTFEFNPPAGTSYPLSIDFEIGSPCPATETITLNGSGEATQSFEVKGILPALLSGSVNQVIPVSVRFEPVILGNNLADAALDSVKFSLSYEKTMLYPNDVAIGSDLENAVGEITMDKSDLGLVKIKITIADDQNLSFGEFAKLDMLVLLGNALSTDVVLESAEFFAQSTITMTAKDDAVFGLNEGCDPENKLVNQVAPPQVIVKGSNPFNESTSVLFKIESKDPADLIIYNSNGERIKALAEQLQGPGEFEYKIDGSEMSSGIYYLSVRAGNYFKIVKLMVKK